MHVEQAGPFLPLYNRAADLAPVQPFSAAGSGSSRSNFAYCKSIFLEPRLLFLVVTGSVRTKA